MRNLGHVKAFVKRKVRAAFIRRPSRSKIHDYWKDPKDSWNDPELYLVGQERSEYLLKLITKYAKDKEAPILELGCNVGRNLNYLYKSGFKNLYGIEINSNAIDIMKLRFPDLAEKCNIFNSSIEDWVESHNSLKFNIIFSMAVLEHIHKESEWLFPYLSRMTNKYIVTIEDEKQVSARHFPRNYKNVFEACGMTQVKEMNCGGIPGLDSNFMARIFVKQNN